MGEQEPIETPVQVGPEQPNIITPEDIPAGETTEKVATEVPDVITSADIPTGEGEVPSTGPEYESPEQPAPVPATVEQARENVAAAEPQPEPTVQPRNTDVTGYNASEGYKSSQVNPDQQRAAADTYAASQGLPTSEEKAATLADQSKPGWVKFLDRFRRH